MSRPRPRLCPLPASTLRSLRNTRLTDQEVDTVADVALSVVRDLLAFFDAKDSPIDEYEGDEGELILDVTASDLAVLIGRHGRTLESLQSLVSLLVSRKLGFRYPVVVDVEGYRSRRHDKVVSMAKSAASRAVAQQRSVSAALSISPCAMIIASIPTPRVPIPSAASSSRSRSSRHPVVCERGIFGCPFFCLNFLLH